MLALLLGNEPDVSEHPTSGARSEPDDILDVIETVIAPRGAGASPWTEEDFKAATAMSLSSVSATANAVGMTTAFPFRGDLPALLIASSTERHPRLGSGLFLRLQLPFLPSREEAAEVVYMLNLLEMSPEANTHTLGAWCLGPAPHGEADTSSVNFVPFVPAVA